MATLSGQKVKDAFASLLKLSSNTATTTLKNVESGDGVATALQIGTTKVGVNGILEFPTVPASGSTETTALLLNAQNQVVRRSLNSAAFSGGAVTSATAPLAITSSNVRLDNPSTINDIGTIANGDRFLVYDISTSEWRRIDYSVLRNAIYPATYISAPEIVGRIAEDYTLTSSQQYIAFADLGGGNLDSLQVGQASSYYLLLNSYGIANDSIRILADGFYEVTLGAALSTSSSNADVTFYFAINGSVVNQSESSFKSTGDHYVTQTSIVSLSSGDVIALKASSTSSSLLKRAGMFHVRAL